MKFAVYNEKEQYLARQLPLWRGAMVRVPYVETTALLRCYSPAIEICGASDAEYTVTPTDVLRDAIPWTLRTLEAQGVPYRTNAFDCENFQRELCQNIAKIAARSGLAVSPLTGGLRVDPHTAWANVLPGGRHQVAGAWTELGWQVIEPQNGIFCSLEVYPNRDRLLALTGT